MNRLKIHIPHKYIPIDVPHDPIPIQLLLINKELIPIKLEAAHPFGSDGQGFGLRFPGDEGGCSPRGLGGRESVRQELNVPGVWRLALLHCLELRLEVGRGQGRRGLCDGDLRSADRLEHQHHNNANQHNASHSNRHNPNHSNDSGANAYIPCF